MSRTAGVISLLLGLAALQVACDAARPTTQHAPAPPGAFPELIHPVRIVRLHPSPESPIVRVSGLDVARDGRIAVTDGADPGAYLFGPDGRLIRRMGGDGSGPGEFRIPYSPRFGPDGRIHVFDLRHERISVFSPDGRHERDIVVRDLLRLSDFQPEKGGTYLAAGVRTLDDPNVVFRLDADGRLLNEFLPIGHHKPRNLRDPALLDGMRRTGFTLTGNGDTAHVVLTTADSLWTLDLQTGAYTVTAIGVAGYVAPTTPPRGSPTVRGLTNWAKTWTSAAGVVSTGGTVVVPFVRGAWFHGDSTILAVRKPDGSWSTVEDGPLIIRGASGYFAGLKDPFADTLEVVLYRPQP